MPARSKLAWHDLADQLHQAGQALTTRNLIDLGYPARTANHHLRDLLRDEPESWSQSKRLEAGRSGPRPLELVPIRSEEVLLTRQKRALARRLTKSRSRIFTPEQKAILFERARGRCQMCRMPLGPDWAADHIEPWITGGQTSIENGQAVCSSCNSRKGKKIAPAARPTPEGIFHFAADQLVDAELEWLAQELQNELDRRKLGREKKRIGMIG